MFLKYSSPTIEIMMAMVTTHMLMPLVKEPISLYDKNISLSLVSIPNKLTEL
jgi:hypothetical protein